jgi:hypothetical protein
MWRITVIYVSGGEDDYLGSPVIAQRCSLSVEEEDHLLHMLPPPGTFIGDLFVTHLTKTNLVKHNMVCFSK